MTILIDGRELEPPEPLQRVLAALSALAPNEDVCALLHCHPLPLFRALEGKGFVWTEDVRADGTHEIRIRRA